MKITLLVVGKTEEEYLKQGISIYEKRLQHYLSFNTEEISALKKAKNLSIEEKKQKEGELILKKISNTDYVVLLDENGIEFTSSNFAEAMQQLMNQGTKRLVFVIGGAYGFSENIYKRADTTFALSKLTFSHQMVRLIFVEQLYRIMTIISGEKDHHG